MHVWSVVLLIAQISCGVVTVRCLARGVYPSLRHAPSGLLTSPLIPAAQVNVLEGGGILVQYTAPVTEDDLASLLAATDAPLTIAPSTRLPATVVATAWTWKLTCDAVDIEALTTFADTRGADAPGDD